MKKGNSRSSGSRTPSRGRVQVRSRFENPGPRFPRAEAPVKLNLKKEQLGEVMHALWNELFTSQKHLDSALSQQEKRMKSILAQLVPLILLRPVSQAEALGVGVTNGEPWALSTEQKATWRPARLMAERLYAMMSGQLPLVSPVADDFPPEWVAAWEKDWGKERTKELVSTLGREAPLSLRASHKFGAADILRILKTEVELPVRAEVSNFAPTAVRLSGYASVLNTEIFRKGGFEIQDEGSQIMSLFALWPEIFGKLLSDAPGLVQIPKKLPEVPQNPEAWTVVDACAGAGGKSLAMADALQGKGRIYSYDTSAGKLISLKRRAKNAGFNSIQTLALKENEESASIGKFRSRANVVLVDAPCSGWGVIRRNPDTKWRQDDGVLGRMPKIQERLLTLYSSLVAPKGRLVFGVCTFRPEETTEIVEKFLAKHPQFKAGPGGYLGPGPCDGFFMQSFERKA